jgi:Flp pilus assembly protein TadD
VSNEAFKRERPLSSREVADYYSANPAALNPALQDETLDRYSAEELATLADNTDPLLEITLRCARGDFAQAFAVAARAFDRYQKVATYWNQVANCHLNQGSHRKALLFYNKALEVQSNYVPALNNIGVMYVRQGQHQKALVAFERAHKQARFAKTPRYNLAKLYLTYGLTETALPLFQGLLSDSPQDVDLLNAVAASHFIQGDYASALNHFQRIPQAHWARPEIGLNLAMTLKQLGRGGDARKVFQLVQKPKGGQERDYYASVERQMGDA